MNTAPNVLGKTRDPKAALHPGKWILHWLARHLMSSKIAIQVVVQIPSAGWSKMLQFCLYRYHAIMIDIESGCLELQTCCPATASQQPCSHFHCFTLVDCHFSRHYSFLSQLLLSCCAVTQLMSNAAGTEMWHFWFWFCIAVLVAVLLFIWHKHHCCHHCCHQACVIVCEWDACYLVVLSLLLSHSWLFFKLLLWPIGSGCHCLYHMTCLSSTNKIWHHCYHAQFVHVGPMPHTQDMADLGQHVQTINTSISMCRQHTTVWDSDNNSLLW